MRGGPVEEPVYSEEAFLALTDGSVAVFPGSGGSAEHTFIVECVAQLAPPCPELLRKYADVVLVRGDKSSLAYEASTVLMQRKWEHDR